MKNVKSFLGAAGILAATTIGAGMFSLPYVFRASGWLAGIFYLIVLGAILVFVHYLYWLALERIKERNRLLGLVRAYLGERAFYPAFISIIGGLLLVLVIYLILAGQFLKFLLPGIGASGIVIFWLLASLPLFLKLRRFAAAESFGTILMLGIVALIFFTANLRNAFSAGGMRVENLFLPFGAIFFSLTGWTAIEPMFELRSKPGESWNPAAALATGTFLSAFVYLLFMLGIFGSTGMITSDTISGLSAWPAWKLQLLGWLGLFAIWTSYVAIARAIKNSLEADMRLSPVRSSAIVLFLPFLFAFFGVFSFLSAIGLAGGIFLALQYVFIISVSKKVLNLGPMKEFVLNTLVLLFLLAAVYEVYYFVVG